MTIYIAFLQGINVGGHNNIKMAELKRMFEAMGLIRVQTYIQSGNILFEAEEESEPLRRRLELEIKGFFSISTTVVMRTSVELNRIIENCPFTEKNISEAAALSDIETFYVSMLLESPSQEKIEQLRTFTTETDEFQIQGREVYLLLRKGVRNSKLVSNLSRLNVPSTMRNWKTMNKLNSLVKSASL